MKIKITDICCYGEYSECCNAPTECETDGDADWLICSKCGNPCNSYNLEKSTKAIE